MVNFYVILMELRDVGIVGKMIILGMFVMVFLEEIYIWIRRLWKVDGLFYLGGDYIIC